MKREDETFQLDRDVVKKARRSSYRKMIGMSAIVLFVGGLAALVLLGAWNSWSLHRTLVEEELRASVYGANRHVGTFDESVGPVTARAETVVYSLVRGRPVDHERWTTDASNRTLLHDGETGGRFSQQSGRKVKQLYVPGVTYEVMDDDQPKLERMPQTTVAEVAVSFTKEEPLESWLRRVPDSVTPLWVWFGNQGANEEDEPVTDEWALGMSLVDDAGVPYDDPVATWIEDATRYVDKTDDAFVREQLERVTKGNVAVTGAVVTGRPNVLATWNDPSIRTMSIGAVIDDYEEETT